MSIQFNPDDGVVRVEVCVRGGKEGDLSRYIASGALRTLDSIAATDQGPARRKLISCLIQQARSLMRNEDELRSAAKAGSAKQ
ncbi:TPA: hypothetical protein ACKPX2_000608 [Stenotrophomonas maltophilia]|uniref:hypothetical protein n=1 Tax=Stenotrophomonas maltophilia TaxID=40324 RepID=UPI0013DB1FEC|nr:hypothetical protein [Stenotrophomonas maltophilia]HEL3245904.1 hypothetical protein [Stenotrophomonas maltophilia]